MKILQAALFCLIFLAPVLAQDKLPTIKTASDRVSIQDGENLRKDTWTLNCEVKPDIYETSVTKGKTKKVSFITDLDRISFDVEAGKTYDFVIQKGETKCHTQIKGNELHFWNDSGFWESPAIKTPYSPNISDAEKIAGLSKFWSEAKYNFINFPSVPGLDWDKAYLEFIPKVLATKSTLEYYRILQMFCSLLGDGHTNVYVPDALAGEVYGRPSIRTRLVQDRVVIIQILDEKLKAEGLKLGQEVLEIDDQPVNAYAAQHIAPYVSESTPQSLETRIYQYNLLSGRVGSRVRFTIKDHSGQIIRKTLPRLSPEESGKLVKPRPGFELEILPGNIAHVKINSMMPEDRADQLFIENFPKIEKADAIILDLRNNGGGNSGVGYRILAFLTDLPFKGTKWFTREYHPVFRPWGRADKAFGSEATQVTIQEIKRIRGENVQPFTKPVVVLTSPRTFSAAEDFLVAFRPLKRGLVIGEPTGGSTGQPLFISLPGGGTARICSKRDTFPDGTEFVGIGIIPDIQATPKISDLVEGKDHVLQVAVDKLRKP